ncbi:ankyrin repeat and LEM domain-containing protein 1 isoform X2 [Patagioenas fasciata]|uniref:ankyrin repeat and LEM domain-containing protein 1 isoform X2 n=1 Tax=Patagioenas fasciata TaxID=372321 RepID=UPI003A98E25C
MILRDLQHTRGWDPVEDPWVPRRSLSFLTEDDTESSVTSGVPNDVPEPLSSTHKSLLEELGGGCDSGDPLLWWGHPQAPPSLPPQPLASSTLLSDGDELGAGPQSRTVGTRTGGHPRAVPKPSAGDIPNPSPQQEFGPGGSLSCSHPWGCRRVLGGHGVSPRTPVLRGGLSGCSMACQCPGDGDISGVVTRRRPGVPQGPPRGWAGLGIAAPAAPSLGTTVLTVGTGGWDSSSLGDSSSASEHFVTAVEILEPSEAEGAQHHCSPQPRAARGTELPLASPPHVGEDCGGDSRATPRCADGSEVGGLGELLVQLQGCSLQGSLPRMAEPPCSPAGDVTPWGLEPPRHLHVTPRTRSRLQASAQRLGASSSSSLFDETLEMPRRPPRIRAPRGVPRDPVTTSGHCDTLGGEDVSSGDREGTGSLDDTEILPRAPSQTSSPGSSPTVLLVPGDTAHPQGTPGDAQGSPGSSPTVLLVPGDTAHPQGTPGDAQGSPGSSPTVLLVPGDTAHPQDTPRDAQGSPGSSPMVLLVPGDTGNPQDTPRDAQGSPRAAGSPPNLRMLQGDSGLHDPPPLGTHRPLQPHGSSICLRAPQPPSASLSPTGYSTHCTGEHPKDEEGDQAPTECHSPSTEATSSSEDTVVRDERGCRVLPHPLSDESLRRRLRALGDNPGPVTEFTRRLYLRRLEQLARGHQGTRAGHSPELVAALRSGHIPNCAQDELVLAQQFDRPDRSRRWREGLLKSSFNYLLLDPRITQNLPLRSHQLSPAECFRTFVKSIFYVGKGTRARPYRHFTEALSQHRAGTQRGCPKVRRILEIWASGHGVVSVLCFQNCVPAEAYTRESCIVEALGIADVSFGSAPRLCRAPWALRVSPHQRVGGG